MTKIQNELVIKTDYTLECDDFYKTIAITYSLTLAIFLISSLFSLYALIPLFMFTFGLALIVFVYMYYRYCKYEWIFDKSLNKVHLKKVSPSFKRKRAYDLSKIEYISYQIGHYWSPYNYDLRLFLKNKKNGKRIYVGEKKKCEIVGDLISKFLERPLNYDNSKEIKIYWE